MSVSRRFRDEIRSYAVTWLSDRHAATPELSAGFRFLWTMVAPLDAAMDVLVQGITAAWPGAGTNSALPLIGRSRGIIRGRIDTDDVYAAKLRAWLDKWPYAGTMRQLAIEIQQYLGTSPMVRIVNRAGYWTTVDSAGVVTTTQQTWSWDGTSNPERAGYWSEIWIIIYPTPYAVGGTWGDGRTWGGRDAGIGQRVTRVERQALRSIIDQWKSAHTKVRAVIWTSDASLFNPAVPASLPAGTWGEWATHGAGSCVAAGRNQASCRYWIWER